MPQDLPPAPRRSTVENLAAALREAIEQGVVAPGAQLGEADLAARFGVSRGPLREAMQRLVSEGLLHAIANRGVFVPELTMEGVRDVYRTRSAIERAAAELLHAEGRHTAAHARLQPILATMRAAAARGDGPGVSDADRAFHAALVAASGSPRLQRAMATLLVETRMYLSELRSTYTSLDQQVLEHDELADALASDGPFRMDALLRAHFDDAVARLTGSRSPLPAASRGSRSPAPGPTAADGPADPATRS